MSPSTPIYGKPHLTAIGSGKGGTGKTLSRQALRTRLRMKASAFLLCDADLGLSNTSCIWALTIRRRSRRLLAGDCALDRRHRARASAARPCAAASIFSPHPPAPAHSPMLGEPGAQPLLAKLRRARL